MEHGIIKKCVASLPKSGIIREGYISETSNAHYYTYNYTRGYFIYTDIHISVWADTHLFST